MSNTERQRLFRERHPGYYQRLHAKRRAAVNERLKAQAFAEAMAAHRPILALPAPVETLEIPGMITFSTIATSQTVAEPVMISLPRT